MRHGTRHDETEWSLILAKLSSAEGNRPQPPLERAYHQRLSAPPASARHDGADGSRRAMNAAASERRRRFSLLRMLLT